jgi:hypothetical protein
LPPVLRLPGPLFFLIFVRLLPFQFGGDSLHAPLHYPHVVKVYWSKKGH